MRILWTITALCAFSTVGFALTIDVPAGYSTIQEAIDAAVNGDTVLVASGTYPENIDFLGKAITVKSSDGAEVTMIDGGGAGSVVTFKNREGGDTELKGFSITNGNAANGGGIFCYYSSPVISDNVIVNNTADLDGGGIFCKFFSNPTIKRNTISENSAQDEGGGICCYFSSSPMITENTISENSANDGGGICCLKNTTPAITKNTISRNQAYNNGGGIGCMESSANIKNNMIMENTASKSGGIGCWFYSSAIITDNTISENSAGEGGGIGCYTASPTITNNTISRNTAGDSAGGIICYDESSPIITNNIVSENSTGGGAGGIYCCYHSLPIITANTIIENSAAGDAGGIFCLDNCHLTITDNTISDNSAGGDAAGIYCHTSSPTIKNNSILSNSAGRDAGGIFCFYSYYAIITNNIISRNTALDNAGGIYCHSNSSPTITNNTILENSADNAGGGIRCYKKSSPVVVNTVLRNNTSQEGPEIQVSYQSVPAIRFSNVKGGLDSISVEPDSTLVWGDGMIDEEPLFVDAANGDYHLTRLSPCRDTGDNNAITEPYDFEGDPRIAWGGTVDMGADEFYTVALLYYTGEAMPEETIDITLLGLPEGVAVLYLGKDIFDQPMHTIYGDWFLVPPIINFYLGPIPWNGIITLHEQIPSDCPVPLQLPLQAMVQERLSNLCAIKVIGSPEKMHIPEGTFMMGDHHGDGFPNELPAHSVYINPFFMEVFEVTNEKYCAFLNSAFKQGLIRVSDGVICRKNGGEPYCDTTISSPYSRITCQGCVFGVKSNYEDHPVTEVSWYGAAAYANWLSSQEGRMPCYDSENWNCFFGTGSYRLPTEAEWEYAARGGHKNPYYNYPWGNTLTGSNANHWDSGDPYGGTYPHPETTPVGYYDGNQVPSGIDMANGYGLHDMAGNVNEWCNDWFSSTYYNSSPSDNPTGSHTGAFRVFRG
ncbi:MAG: SUMF1/EgtB/PvdO family nonheme iron enzyme, partial [Planctomycetes bacterium]|nr:SUMF1/EgtB/PvdO family nonheme iron enzyme [Planctomycetota bacterium]